MKPALAVLGIDFGATNVKLAAFDAGGNAILQRVEASSVEQGPDATVLKLAEIARRAIDDASQLGYAVEAIGVGVCAPVAHPQGEIVESSVLPGWRNVPVAEPLRASLGLPVAVENDSNVAVLGEWWRGSAQNASVVAGLTLGTGIGGGLVVEGRIFRGSSGFAAEFGHISVADGPDCPCRGRGCLGRVASITATLDRYREMAGASGLPAGNISELAELAAGGNSAACEAVAISANYLAKAALTIANCLNPDVFVLAGGMASSLGGRLLDPVREKIHLGAYRCIVESVRVVSASLGIYSGCYGAAWLALSRLGAPTRG
jgi:glucokinase